MQGESITSLKWVSQYQMFFLIRCWFRGNTLLGLSGSFIIIFQKNGSAYISCYHLKFEILLKPSSC